MSVRTEALPRLKCTACNKFLSHFPIYLAQNSQSNLPICGRCSELLTIDEKYVRHSLYESVAQFLKFPCCYRSKGCIETLIPVDIPLHEKYCPYRVISCSLDCIWQGTLNELLDHFEEMHPNEILKNGEFEIDIFNSYEVFNLLIYNDEIFSFKRKFDRTENILQCSLFCYKMLDSVTKYNYEISVQNASGNLSVSFHPKCADNFQETNVTEVNIDDIKLKLNDPSIIIGQVNIFTLEDKKEVTPKKPNSEINVEMLNELKCPVCFDNIIPPICQCVNGHSICGDCKNKVSECPTCEGEIGNTRNVTLDKMAFHLTYPCKFTEYGCDFASEPGKIKQHQKYCVLGPQECPLKDYKKCAWKSTAEEICAHVFNVHHDSVLEIENISVFISDDYFVGEDNQCYIKTFSNVLFRLHYRYFQKRFYWAVQFVGSPDDAKIYKFEIDIQDNSNNNQKMFVRSVCSSLKDKNETFVEGGQFIFLNLEQIKSFITDQFTYNIRIIK